MLRSTGRVLVIGIVMTLATACASANHASGSSRSSSTVIVAEDLRATTATNLYDAIRSLHPEWFRRPGATPVNNRQDYSVAVFVDNQRAGGTEILQQTSVTQAASVRYYSPSEAQMRFGNGNQNGAIQVVTVTGGASKP